MRQRNGRTATAIATGEDADVAMTAVQIYVATHARIVADEHPAYNLLHVTHAAVERVNHDEAYRGEDGASTNWVESFFSRARRSEREIHHHMASQYLDWYAADLAWKEDMRRKSNGDLLGGMLSKALAHPVRRWLCGYWQGRHPPRDAFLFHPRLAVG